MPLLLPLLLDCYSSMVKLKWVCSVHEVGVTEAKEAAEESVGTECILLLDLNSR